MSSIKAEMTDTQEGASLTGHKSNETVRETQHSIRLLSEEDVLSLSNKDKRFEFIKNYEDWGIWYEDDKSDIQYYRCDLPDGSYLVVAVFKSGGGNPAFPKGMYAFELFSFVKAGEYYYPGTYYIEAPILDHLKDLSKMYKEARRKMK